MYYFFCKSVTRTLQTRMVDSKTSVTLLKKKCNSVTKKCNKSSVRDRNQVQLNLTKLTQNIKFYKKRNNHLRKRSNHPDNSAQFSSKIGQSSR